MNPIGDLRWWFYCHQLAPDARVDWPRLAFWLVAGLGCSAFWFAIGRAVWGLR